MIGLHLIDDPRHLYKPTISLWFHRLFVCLSTLAHPSLTEWIPSTLVDVDVGLECNDPVMEIDFALISAHT